MKIKRNLFIVLSLFVIGLNETLIDARGQCVIRCFGDGRERRIRVTSEERFCNADLARQNCDDRGYPRSQVLWYNPQNY